MRIEYKTVTDYKQITLENSAGMQLTLTALGAAIREVKMTDREGVLRTVTLCPTNEKVFREKHYGKTVGRTAGRIANATFTIDGKTAVLEKNNFGTDNLHGGEKGFHSVIFADEVRQGKEYTDVVFSYTSPDGEGGYFGTVDVKVTYRVWETRNIFSTIYDATTDTKTLLNLTNHVYWNMSGDLRESAKDQMIRIVASNTAQLNERLCIEEIIPVPNTMDFRVSHKMGDHIGDESVQRYTRGYDHPYFLDQPGLQHTACAMQSNLSGIRLDVTTTYPCVVFYANCQAVPKNEVFPGKRDEQYLAACFECQYNPDGIHRTPDDCGVLSPDKPYHEETRYIFTVK